MPARTQITILLTLVDVAMAAFGLPATSHAGIITTDLSIHYRADNVGNLGTPGDGSTTTLVTRVTFVFILALGLEVSLVIFLPWWVGG